MVHREEPNANVGPNVEGSVKRYYTMEFGFWLDDLDGKLDTARMAASIQKATEERIGELSGDLDLAEHEHHEDMDKEV